VLVAHTAGDATAIVAALRQAIRAVDPEIAIAEASPLQQVVDKSLEGRRYQMWLFVAFGAIALLIAAVGVYATTAYGVSRRRLRDGRQAGPAHQPGGGAARRVKAVPFSRVPLLYQ
jgi:putative ABC transport system permease protein